MMARRPARPFRLVFLDFDGVLNSTPYLIAQECADERRLGEASDLDPAAVRRLNRILWRTGAHVVISSSWRLGRSVKQLRALLRACGFRGTILDKTPWLDGEERGDEIRSWLDRARSSGFEVESFVVLDDNSDMSAVREHFVQTDMATGLTDADADRASEILLGSRVASRGPKPRDVSERFWCKVDRNGPVPAHRPELGACWVWMAARYKRSGYGAFRFGSNIPDKPERRTLGAHTVAFWLTHHRWAKPECCHSCDNRVCVRPSHLFESTHDGNMKDMAQKGRAGMKTPLRGIRNPAAKLSPQAAEEIRASIASGTTVRALATQYGVSVSTVRNVHSRRFWREA